LTNYHNLPTYICALPQAVFVASNFGSYNMQKNQCIREKNGSTEHSTGNKTVPEKMATARTEDGRK